jgi:hypothetical protein
MSELLKELLAEEQRLLSQQGAPSEIPPLKDGATLAEMEEYEQVLLKQQAEGRVGSDGMVRREGDFGGIDPLATMKLMNKKNREAKAAKASQARQDKAAGIRQAKEEGGFGSEDDEWYEKMYVGFTEGDNFLQNAITLADELTGGEQLTDEQKQAQAATRDQALDSWEHTAGSLMADVVGWTAVLAALPALPAVGATGGALAIAGTTSARLAASAITKRIGIYSAEGAATMMVDGGLSRNATGEEQKLSKVAEDAVIGATLGVAAERVSTVAKSIYRKYNPDLTPIDIQSKEGGEIARKVGTDIESLSKRAKQIEKETTLNPEASLEQALKEKKITNEKLIEIGVDPRLMKAADELSDRQFDKVQKREARISERKGAFNTVTGFVREKADQWGGIMSTRVSNLDAPVGGRMRRADVETNVIKGEADDLHKGLRKVKEDLTKDQLRDINLAFYNSKGRGAVAKVIQSSTSIPDSKKAEYVSFINQAWDAKDKMGDQLLEGANVKRIKDHWPRQYNGKDVGKLKEAEDPLLYLVDRDVTQRKTANVKKREKAVLSSRDVTDGDYLDFDDSFGFMMEAASRAVPRREMFRVDGKLPKYGEGLNTTIQRLIESRVASGDLLEANSKAMFNILKARYGKGEQSPDKALQWLSAVNQAAVMGQVESAIVQVGDIGTSVFVNGLGNTIRAIPYMKSINPSGVVTDQHIIAQLGESSKGFTPHNMIAKLFKWNGLSTIDSAIKGVSLKASQNKIKRELKTQAGVVRFLQKHKGGWSQGELMEMIPRLQDGVVDRDTKAILFSELLDAQPVGLSETTEFLAGNPNMRIWGSIKGY